MLQSLAQGFSLYIVHKINASSGECNHLPVSACWLSASFRVRNHNSLSIILCAFSPSEYEWTVLFSFKRLVPGVNCTFLFFYIWREKERDEKCHISIPSSSISGVIEFGPGDTDSAPDLVYWVMVGVRGTRSGIRQSRNRLFRQIVVSRVIRICTVQIVKQRVVSYYH